MCVTVDELLKRALELEPRAREELATLLLESVPAAPQDEVDAAWETTVRRRVQELASGDVDTVPWEDVRRKLARSEGGA